MTPIRAMTHWSGNAPGLEIPFTYVTNTGFGTIPGTVLLWKTVPRNSGVNRSKKAGTSALEKFCEPSHSLLDASRLFLTIS